MGCAEEGRIAGAGKGERHDGASGKMACAVQPNRAEEGEQLMSSNGEVKRGRARAEMVTARQAGLRELTCQRLSAKSNVVLMSATVHVPGSEAGRLLIDRHIDPLKHSSTSCHLVLHTASDGVLSSSETVGVSGLTGDDLAAHQRRPGRSSGRNSTSPESGVIWRAYV